MTKFLLAAMTSLVLATAAAATPGQVDSKGCHGKPKHCHSSDSISKNSRGRYVPFGNG